MNNTDIDDDVVLSGTILKIPLIIEDEDTSQTIKTTNLWIHVSRADYEPSNNPQFINISLTGIYTEGYFHTTLTLDNTRRLFRKNIPNLNVENDTNLFKLLENLFPLDLESLIESKSTEGYHQNLKLVAKLIGNKTDYDDKEEFIDDRDPNTNPITISIKTNAKLAITVGTFQMQPIEFEDHPNLSEEGNLFNWLELYNQQNELLLKELAKQTRDLDALKLDNDLLQRYCKSAKLDYEKIIKDLEEKFYQALNTKKDKIYELLYGGGHGEESKNKKLVGLNDTFLKNEGRLNEIDKDTILDEFSDSVSSGSSKRKISKGSLLSSKRRKANKFEPDESTSANEVEIKVEPRSTEESSYNGKSIKRKGKSYIQDKLHLKKEPKSPESKDPSTNYDDQEEEREEDVVFKSKPSSFIEDSLAKSSKSQNPVDLEDDAKDQTDYSDDETGSDNQKDKALGEDTGYSEDTEADDDIPTVNNNRRDDEETDYSDDSNEEVKKIKRTISIELKDSSEEPSEIKDSLRETRSIEKSVPSTNIQKSEANETDYSDSDSDIDEDLDQKEESIKEDNGLETDYSDDSE